MHGRSSSLKLYYTIVKAVNVQNVYTTSEHLKTDVDRRTSSIATQNIHQIITRLGYYEFYANRFAQSTPTSQTIKIDVRLRNFTNYLITTTKERDANIKKMHLKISLYILLSFLSHRVLTRDR